MPSRKLNIGEPCTKGHLLTEDTAYVYPDTAKLAGVVVCKVCRMNWQRKRKGLPEQDSIGTWNRNKTHCTKGHEYTEENTLFKNDGSRGCKRCHAMRMRKRNYGITHEQFDALWEQQDGKCAICANPFESISEASVDHSHTTDAIRGLLCNSCNNGLGRFKDNIEYLQAAIKYLSDKI